MARNVADLMWKMLQKAGVKRCYGIVGDALITSVIVQVKMVQKSFVRFSGCQTAGST